MNQLEAKMEDFLEKAEATLKKVEKASNTLQWVASIVVVALLGFSIDTRVKVEEKVTSSELKECQQTIEDRFLTIEKNYLSKKDALIIHDNERIYYEGLVKGMLFPYPETVNNILKN